MSPALPASVSQTAATPRVSLTAVNLDDAVAVNRWKNDEELQLSSSDIFVRESLDETRARLERWMASNPDEVVHFAIRLVDTQSVVGFCHLAQIDPRNQSCKLGIVLGERQLWGRGLGSEALKALVEHAFARQLTRVAAEAYASNVRSIRMLERVGFEREGVLRRGVRRRQGWEDAVLYAMLAPERLL